MDKYYIFMNYGDDAFVGADSAHYTLEQVLERSGMRFISKPFDTLEEANQALEDLR